MPNLVIIDTASEDVHTRDIDVYGWAGTITASLERTFAGGGGAPRYFSRFSGVDAPVPFRETVAGLVDEGADAIAVIGINDPPPVVQEVIAVLENEARPTVYISWEDVPSPTPHVFYDNQMASLQAAQHLLRAVGLRPEIAAIHYFLGQTYARQGDWQQARQALTEALRRDSPMLPAHYDLARVDQHLGDTAGAAVEHRRYQRMLADWTRRHDLDSRLTVLPDDVPARLELARLCARNGDADEAAFQYRQILARRPGFAPARAGLASLTAPAPPAPARPAELLTQADALRVQKQWGPAGRLYSRVFNRDHTSAPAAQGLGLVCRAQGQTRQALFFLAYATRLTPHLPDAQAALAQMYHDAGHPDEARKRLELAVQDSPGRADLWHALGKAAGESALYAARAEQALARAVALAPDNTAYRLDLAEQEANDSRTQDAEADYRRALALAPHNPDALSRLGGFLVDTSPTPPRLREAARPRRTVTLGRRPPTCGWSSRPHRTSPRRGTAWDAPTAGWGTPPGRRGRWPIRSACSRHSRSVFTCRS